MSMSFDNPLTEEQQKIRDEFLGDSMVAGDEKTALFEHFNLQREEMSKLANAVEQPVTVEINDIGDTKTMSDGTKYHLTKQGWRKI